MQIIFAIFNIVEENKYHKLFFHVNINGVKYQFKSSQ